MQRHFTFLFIVFFSLLLQSIDTQSQSHFTQKADSLFNEKEYTKASILYEELLDKHNINREHTYLKLAYINEQKGDFSRAIFYLSAYYQLNPTDKIFDKIVKMAEENSFLGFGRNDLNFFLMLFHQYFIWIILILLILAFSIFFILFKKQNREEKTHLRNKLGLLFILIGALIIVMMPKEYAHGIVNKENVILRSSPSSAAEIALKLPKGSRVNIIGQEDIWLRILINRKIIYAKETDFWIIEEE